MDTILLLLSFQGRLNRARYWAALIALTAVIAAIAAVIRLIVPELGWSIDPAIRVLLSLIIGLPWLVAMLAIPAKRLHDFDFSGWWTLLVLIVGGDFVVEAFSLAPFNPPLGYAILLAGLVMIGIPRGTVGTNRFGRDPQETKAQEKNAAS